MFLINLPLDFKVNIIQKGKVKFFSFAGGYVNFYINGNRPLYSDYIATRNSYERAIDFMSFSSRFGLGFDYKINDKIGFRAISNYVLPITDMCSDNASDLVVYKQKYQGMQFRFGITYNLKFKN